MNSFTPSVVAPLESWDDTSDVIVFLIEQKEELHINQYADLVLEHLPEQYHGSRRFVTPENQSAQLEGYIAGKGKIRLEFTAEYRDDIVDAETGNQIEGYNVTVTRKFVNDWRSKPELFVSYVVAGSDRSDFAVISEVKAEA